MKGVRVGSKNDITMPATKVTVAKKKEEINAWNSDHNGKYNVGNQGTQIQFPALAILTYVDNSLFAKID